MNTKRKITSVFVAAINIIALFCTLSCDNSHNATPTLGQTERIMVSEKNDYPTSDIFDSISFLMLKEKEGAYFSTISKMEIIKDRILIFDKISNSLLAFDTHGDFINSYSRRGKANNEYMRLSDVEVDSNYVYLYDRASKKMLYYDFSGNFIKSATTEFRGEAFYPINGNRFLFSMAKEEHNMKLCVVDSSFQIKDCLLSYKEEDLDNKFNNIIFRGTDDRILYNKPVCDTIYFFSKSGELQNSFLMDFNGKNVPDDIKGNFEELAINRKNENYIYMYECPMIINNVILATVFHQGHSATLIYNQDIKKGSVVDWADDNKLSNMILPVYSNQEYIVGWMDDEVFESITDKERLNEEMVQHLKKGGRILIFYHLKNNR